MADDEDHTPLLGPGQPKNREDLQELKEQIKFPSCRFWLSVMGFLGFVNVYALRVNLSVAMVAMVNSSYRVQTGVNTTEACPVDNSTNTTNTYSGEFNWNSNKQGLVLGAFFYGYITTQIPGGYLAGRFGGKWLYGLGVLCTAVFTILTPVATRLDPGGYLFIVVRVLEGIGEGVTFPAMCAMLAKWAPVYERSKLGAFIYSGAQFGTVISMPISGLLCQYGPFGGWPSVFYIFGALGCVWFVAWSFVVYSSPAEHPRISEEEKTYILESIGEEDDKMPVPWVAILTSVKFWALLIAHTCSNWGFYTLLTCMPTFMSEILHFDISQNGFVSAIPYLFNGIIMASAGSVIDSLRHKNILSTTKVRKLANVIGLGTPAIALAFIGYAGCNKVLVIALLSIAVGVSGVSTSGYGVNHLDLAPPFAGTLFGITNAAATIPGFLGPQVVGALTTGHITRLRWQIVFWISSIIYTFGTVFYVIFGSGEEQKWAKPEYAEIQRLKKESKRQNVQVHVPEPVLSFSQPNYDGY